MSRFQLTYVLPAVSGVVLVMVSICPPDATARVGITSATDGYPSPFCGPVEE